MVEVDPAALIRLTASQRSMLRLDQAREAFALGELDWLGSPIATVAPGRRAFRSDLGLPLRAVGRDLEFRKAAIVELGPLREQDGRLSLDLTWRSATFAPLFPVFAGQLTMTDEQVALDGWYAPPGGSIGVAFDRALLGIAARRTAAWFLRVVAQAFSSAPARAEQQQYADNDDHDRPQRTQLRNAGDPA